MNDLCCVVACMLVHCTPLHKALPRVLVFWLLFMRVSGSNPAIRDRRNFGCNYYTTSAQHRLHRKMFKTFCFGTINVAEVPFWRWPVRMSVGYTDRQSPGLLRLSSVAPDKVETVHTISPWKLILQCAVIQLLVSIEKSWKTKWRRSFHTVVCTVYVYQVIVYNLVQHYAHTYTAKLYSDMFRWRISTIIKEDNTTDQNTPLFGGVLLVTHTQVYFAYAVNTELLVSHFQSVNGLWCIFPDDSGSRHRHMSENFLPVSVSEYHWIIW